MVKSIMPSLWVFLDVAAFCSVLHVANRLLEASKKRYGYPSSRRVLLAQNVRRCRVYVYCDNLKYLRGLSLLGFFYVSSVV
jgi:hypothetical protein